jgi:hypothetical protein
MALTEAQYDQLAADIAADPVLRLLPHNGDSAVMVKDAYNLLATPAFWVWKTMLQEQEVYEATVDGTQRWSWATYKGQSVQDRDAWARMWAPGAVNPALQQTRDGWLAIFGGQGASQVQVNYLLALARMQATRAEKLFADTSQGAGTTAAPATRTHQGPLTAWDVEQAWAV